VRIASESNAFPVSSESAGEIGYPYGLFSPDYLFDRSVAGAFPNLLLIDTSEFRPHKSFGTFQRSTLAGSGVSFVKAPISGLKQQPKASMPKNSKRNA